MSATPALRAGVGRALPWVAVVLGIALVVAVAGRGPEEGNPLDPASPGPLGTKGLVEVLRAVGGRVAVSADTPGAGTDTALLLSDNLTLDRREIGRALPDAAADFAGATELFELAWYGRSETGSREAARLRDLSGRVLERAGGGAR